MKSERTSIMGGENESRGQDNNEGEAVLPALEELRKGDKDVWEASLDH